MSHPLPKCDLDFQICRRNKYLTPSDSFSTLFSLQPNWGHYFTPNYLPLITFLIPLLCRGQLVLPNFSRFDKLSKARIGCVDDRVQAHSMSLGCFGLKNLLGRWELEIINLLAVSDLSPSVFSWSINLLCPQLWNALGADDKVLLVFI